MKKFIIDVFGFGLLLMGTLLLMAFFSNQYTAKDLFVKEFPVKEKMAQESIGEKRLIFIGGSNLAFGIDSKKISEELGIPVLNLGLHAGMGLKLMLDTYTPLVSSNDIVVISPEYGHFWNNTAYGEPTTMGELPYIHNFGKYVSYCNYSQIENILSGFPTQAEKLFLQSALTAIIGESESSNTFQYKRSGFDSYGDEVSHLDLIPVNASFVGHLISGNFNERFYNYFINCIEKLEVQGVKVLIIPPSTSEDNYLINEDNIKSLACSLRQYGWIGIPECFSYSDEYMYDTPYHLNGLGRQINTDRIITLLRTENLF